MKTVTAVLALLIFSNVASAQSPDPSKWMCRNLADSGNFVYQGETIFGTQACRPIPQAAPATPTVATAPVAPAAPKQSPLTPTTAAGSGGKLTMLQRIKLIESAVEELRPYLRQDGGDCELVDVDGDCVSVKLSGACIGCQMAAVTIAGVQERLVQKLGMPLRVMPVQ